MEACPECCGDWVSDVSDDEEEFCSCCGEDEEREEIDESVQKVLDEDLDELSLRMFFKGLSLCQTEGSPSGLSGIGVVMEGSKGTPNLQIQKKLDFYAEDLVAEFLALMDGLLEAHNKGSRRVFAFTDSSVVHHQICDGKEPVDQLLAALGQRIMELAKKFEVFVLKLVPSSKIQTSKVLAQEAIGILSLSSDKDKSFLSETIRCPFPDCSMLIGTCDVLYKSTSSARQSVTNNIECPECQRLICLECIVPWHAGMSCTEFQSLSSDGNNSEDVMLHQLAENINWRRCEQCSRMIERTEGCHLMTCWCGFEFCYSCGAEYRNGHQSCHCAYQDEVNVETTTLHSNQDSELWRWDSFELPMSTMDTYTEQERSHLALIHRFLAGGFGLSDQNPCPSPPRCSESFVDTIKDLHQLPWLERFVSVISDNYHDEYMQ